MTEPRRVFFATAARGTEGALRDELRALRLPRVKADRGGVHFEGGFADGMRACLHSRLAMRVQEEVFRGPAAGEAGLYDAVRSVPWEQHLSARHTLAVSATCRDSRLTHSHYIALKTKDAVVDRLRDRLGQRPDVDARDPDVALVARLVRDQLTLYLDLAGDPLHRRGYRRSVVTAVMKETLAAAVVRLSGWTPEAAFLDPLCGAGTLAIEAALVARNIAPGLGRRFGFERWPGFDDTARKAWDALLEEARDAVLPRAPVPLHARDLDPAALEATRANAWAAGVLDDLVLRREDARAVRAHAPEGFVVTDPPYGDRMAAQPLQLAGFARQLGEALGAMTGWKAVVLSGNPLVTRSLGLDPAWEHTLFNGDIECRLMGYALGHGTRAPLDTPTPRG